LTAATKSGPISTEPRPVQRDLVEKAHELKTTKKGFIMHDKVLFCNAESDHWKLSTRWIDMYKGGA
jgi:hypothetical protein